MTGSDESLGWLWETCHEEGLTGAEGTCRRDRESRRAGPGMHGLMSKECSLYSEAMGNYERGLAR